MNAKVIAAAVIIAAIAIGGYYVAVDIKERRVPKAAFQHVRNVSLRLANSLQLEIEPTNITYKEAFDNLAKNVAEIDSRILDVQTLQTARNKAALAPLIRYMKAAQEVLRAQEAFHQKQLAASSSAESFVQAQQELRGATYFGSSYAEAAARRASDQVMKANREFAEAQLRFRVSLEALSSVRESLQGIPDNVLCDPELPKTVNRKLAQPNSG